MHSDQRNRLKSLLNTPTAPFREHLVRQEIARQLDHLAVDYCEDLHGNLIIGAGSLKAYQALLNSRETEPLRIFIAHMDHPGFHARAWNQSGELSVSWLGGSPVKHLRGAKVWLADDAGIVGTGRLKKPILQPSGTAMKSALVIPDGEALSRYRPRAKKLYGGLAFKRRCVISGQRIYASAVDDLGGVHVVCELMSLLHSNRRKRPVRALGLLTRGEEIGFVGALAHLEDGWLNGTRRPVLAVSIETSRTGSGATIGQGPIVRLGDKRTIFNPEYINFLRQVAARVLPNDHQIRLMDGGACEASATMAYGIPTVGISIPLGNYHNQGFEGAPGYAANMGPAPEFVDLRDVKRTITLAKALVQTDITGKNPWDTNRRFMLRRLRRYKNLLRTKA